MSLCCIFKRGNSLFASSCYLHQCVTWVIIEKQWHEWVHTDRETNSFYEFICCMNLYSIRTRTMYEFVYYTPKHTWIHTIYEFMYSIKWSSSSPCIRIQINTHTILDGTVYRFNWWLSHYIKWHGNGFPNIKC